MNRFAFAFLCLLALSPALGQEVFYFDTYHPNDNMAHEVFGLEVMEEDKEYSVQIEGTYSIWVPQYWSDPCGQKEATPLFPSVEGHRTGDVGMDMEFIYSLPTSSLCSQRTLPYRRDRIELSLDNGNTWFHPTSDGGYQADHIYTYRFTGKGFPLGIRHTSEQNSDDYGQFKLRINPISTQPPVSTIDTTMCKTQMITLHPRKRGTSYAWQDGSTDSSFVARDSGFYTVTIVSSADTTTEHYAVRIINCPCLDYIPNAFSPNGDGLNDVFGLSPWCNLPGYRLDIFNRWGERVYRTRSISASWDGEYMGRPCLPGVYMFMIHYKGEAGEDFVRSGTFLLQFH
ncbi:MAG: gliding motility-associated C-terminal domain-containing protein [Bacteroidia bacterium]|nr:gliding motility-associated C-terminal domain-containing protein [Bacteroidia bacterium]